MQEVLGQTVDLLETAGFCRYYRGNEFINENEVLAQTRSLKLFNFDPEEWGFHVQD